MPHGRPLITKRRMISRRDTSKWTLGAAPLEYLLPITRAALRTLERSSYSLVQGPFICAGGHIKQKVDCQTLLSPQYSIGDPIIAQKRRGCEIIRVG